jgi:hypothetical protein
VDSDVLDRYLRRMGPPVAHSSAAERLTKAPFLSLIASCQEEVFRDRGEFLSWPHAEGRLQLNPLYVHERTDQAGTLHLRRKLPSPFYEQDHAEAKQYLAEAVTVERQVWQDMEEGRSSSAVDDLVGQFVLLGLSERYYHPIGLVDRLAARGSQ